MQEISLKYYRGETQFTDSFSIPSTWNELSRSQLHFIAKNWENWKKLMANNYSLLKVKCDMLAHLLPGTKPQIKKRIQLIEKLDAESIYDMAELTAFVLKDNDLTINPIPVIEVKGKKFFGPSNRLSSIIGFEFAFADSQYLKYHKTGSSDALDTLIAILYRPAGDPEKGEVQAPFNNKLIERIKEYTSLISESEKQMILLFYIGSRNKIVASNPDVFVRSNEEKAENGTWIDVIMSLSGGKFGTFNETGAMDFHLILKELAHLKKLKPKDK